MCGIFAYSGKKNAVPVLIDGLQSLEYRGYDSAGVIAFSKNGERYFQKEVGKVSMLNRAVSETLDPEKIFNTGIAHTRWATHGEVNRENTHPHYSSNEQFYIVHNGIIENYLDLRKHLKDKGYSFYSETDSEVIAKLLEEYYNGNIIQSLEKICSMLVGAYAIAIMNKDEPENIYGAKLGSPMILGVSNDGIVLSSDINTVSKYAHEFISLDDREIVKITGNTYQVFSLKQGEYIDKEREKVDDDFSVAHKGNFETFTEKEIHEIPEVLANVCKGRIDFETGSIRSETLESLAEKDYEKIEIIASGSSYFAGLVGCAWFKSLAGIDAEVRVSSEFLYDIFIPQENVLYVFMSQSGETADVRESVRKVQEKGCHTFGIVNTVGSTIARMCDSGMYTHAGIEVGVASTKNVIAQLAVLLMMAVSIGSKKGLQSVEAKTILKELGSLKDTIKEQLVDQDELKKLVESYSHYQNFFFLGRGLLLGTAEEASLKLKELSYLHSEAYATGELKHGPLALVGEDFPCFVMGATQTIYEKTISNVKEISARKAPVVGVVFENSKYQEVYDDVIKIPLTHEQLAPFTTLIPMWLFAVEVAKKLRKDIDKPQNLAKSVTVE